MATGAELAPGLPGGAPGGLASGSDRARGFGPKGTGTAMPDFPAARAASFTILTRRTGMLAYYNVFSVSDRSLALHVAA